MKRFALLLLASTCWPALAHAQGAVVADPSIEQQLQELRAMKRDLDARIDKLETRMLSKAKRTQAKRTAPAVVAADAPAPIEALTPAVPPRPVVVASAPQTKNDGSIDFGPYGRYEPGKGYVVVRGDQGELAVGLITYLRYLNQLELERSYTDSFGRTKELDLRNDFFLNKVNLSFKGWLIDPDFTWRAWIWTQNPAMGLSGSTAQTVVGGHFSYTFADWLRLSGGVAPLPSNRTTNWTYPYWLKMDNRTVADEFFRASYAFGIWADGKIVDDVHYRVMLANNLSALGVDAGQLDGDFSTVSSALWWMPTTGEYGAAEGIGDYDYHEEVATRFGFHYTRSREDAQSQPDTDSFENSQIRLSDGTLLFSPDPFGTGGQVNKATYQMIAANAGLKYEGWSLEAEYYVRWVDEFETTGFVPVTDLFDHGVSVQASAMVLRDQLQVYVAGSQVFGEYGDPWDVTIGANWFPFSRHEVRVNVEGIYLERSPVGGISYPYIVGGDGWVFNTDFIVSF